MNELLFQYIWKHQLFDTKQLLYTTAKETLLVLQQGIQNTNAGPDFSNAKIKIGTTTWAGNIEVHLKSSDWIAHKHQHNKAYNNIILHVVYEHDKEIEMPCAVLELKTHISQKIIHSYNTLYQSKEKIPCANVLKDVPAITILQQQERMLYERLEQKTNYIHTLLQQYNNDWQEVFYILIARSFGLHINQDAFEQLAKSLPLKIIAKHKNNIVQVESMLYGQAGFLELQTSNDDYFLSLQKEYYYLQKVYKLKPIQNHLFKFLRLRPPNFPTIRIAQLAKLLVTSTHLFSKITEAKTIHELKQFFDVETSEYWRTHVHFTTTTKNTRRHLGSNYIDTMLINAIIPTLYIYGMLQANKEISKRAITLLEKIKPEKNAVINAMQSLGVETKHAADTQALLQLKKHYCDKKLCMQCSIGYKILKG